MSGKAMYVVQYKAKALNAKKQTDILMDRGSEVVMAVRFTWRGQEC